MRTGRPLAAAGVLDRPVQVTAGAEGSALGAAALGLLALGRAADLAGAVEVLSPGLEDIAPIVAVPATDHAAYRRLHHAVPDLLAGYREVARLFEPHRVPVTHPCRHSTDDDPADVYGRGVCVATRRLTRRSPAILRPADGWRAILALTSVRRSRHTVLLAYIHTPEGGRGAARGAR